MRIRLSLILIVILITACAGPVGTPPQTSPQTSLPLSDCLLSSPGLSNQISARCGNLEVPEDRANPGGRKLNLNVVVVKAQSANPAADPLFLLAGGPGQAASEAYLPIISQLGKLNFKHDFVLLDQRGTGKSNPLHCENKDVQDLTDAGIPDPQKITAAFTACLPKLAADPRYYTTAIFAQDLEAVRTALGYGPIDILGVSYGTRAALAYLKAYPQNVRAVVLDGIVPPGWYIGQSLRQDAQHSLDQLFARCAADPACLSAFPDLPGDLKSLIARLDATPQTVTLPAPLTGSQETVKMDGRIAAALLRQMSYSSDYSALIPWILHTAAKGDLRSLAAQYLSINAGSSGGFEPGLFYAVLCSEDMPFLPASGEQGDFFFSDPLPNFRAACAAYPPNPQPVANEWSSGLQTPALLLSGGADPVTPPANGEALAKLLPNSRHIVLPGMGHGNAALGCIPNLIAELLKNANPAGLDVTCTRRIAPPPFFLSAIGPEP